MFPLHLAKSEVLLKPEQGSLKLVEGSDEQCGRMQANADIRSQKKALVGDKLALNPFLPLFLNQILTSHKKDMGEAGFSTYV